MTKSKVIVIAAIGILVATLSVAGVSAARAGCGSTCGSKSAGEARVEKSAACAGETEQSSSEKKEATHGFLTSYFGIRHLLAKDEVEGLSKLSTNLAADTEEFWKIMAGQKASSEQLEALEQIEDAASALKAGKKSYGETERLKAARKNFRTLSHKVLAYVQEYGWDGTAYSFYCPMAKDSWLQETDKVGNPYYGSEMFRCGKMTGHVMKGKYMATKDAAMKMEAETKEVAKGEHGHH